MRHQQTHEREQVFYGNRHTLTVSALVFTTQTVTDYTTSVHSECIFWEFSYSVDLMILVVLVLCETESGARSSPQTSPQYLDYSELTEVHLI